MNLFALLFSWDGRIDRKTFWFGFLLSLSFFGIITAINHFIIYPMPIEYYFMSPPTSLYTEKVYSPRVISYIIYCITWFLSGYMNISLFIKRLHDCDRSGWNILISLIPIIGPLYLFLYVGFTPGTLGLNKFDYMPAET